MTNRFIIILAVHLAFGSFTAMAQGPFANPDQVKAFTKTKLLVVLDGHDVAFDAFLKDAVTKHWSISEFEFVDGQRFSQEKANPNFSFLVTLQIQFDNDPQENIYHYLHVLLSHPTGDIKDMPVLAQLPFLGSTLTSSSHLHKTEMLVKFLQEYASNVVTNNGSAKYKKLNHLNKSIKALNGKTLVVAESQIDHALRSEELLKSVYKHNVQLVTDDELAEVINNAEKGIVVLHIVAPDLDANSGRCFKMIIEPATGEAFFYKTHKISSSRPPVMLRNDFRKIRWYPFHWL
jgi:hypothetical protein